VTWYAAHLVLYVKLKQRRQTRFPAWENIVLIRARSEDEAFAKAEARDRQDALPDDSFTWNGEQAEWVFAGVRKLTLCDDPEQRPGDGTEVSYLELELESKEALKRFVEGEPVSVRIEDGFPEEEPAAAAAAATNGRRRR
jgi:hypothetical protein